MADTRKRRRQLIAGLGTTAAAVALGTSTVAGQAPSARFQPARHSEDDWFASLRGKHRVILDTTSPGGVANAIRFAGNLFNGSKSGYDVDEADMAIVICLRHRATPYAYTDELWSKYGRVLNRNEDDPDTSASAPVPTTNTHNSGGHPELSDLARRGLHFMVCATASRNIARRVAGASGDADAIFKELGAHLIPNGHFVAAGVVGVTHAQEVGYSYLFVG